MVGEMNINEINEESMNNHRKSIEIQEILSESTKIMRIENKSTISNEKTSKIMHTQ